MIPMTPRDGGPLLLSGTPVETNIDNGVNLPMMLYRAAENGPQPAVILCPGGIGTGMFEILEWAGTRLRKAGFHALTTSWRSSSPLEDPSDVSAAFDWLAEQSFVDGNRIGVFGVSRGGNAALRAAAADHRLRAVATFGAATDFLQQVYGTATFAPARHRMITGWLGDPITNRTFYEKVQAIDHVQNITQPLLLLHGEHDMHAPVEQSIAVRDKVIASGNSQVELTLFPVVGHFGEVVPSGFAYDHISEHLLTFLRRVLG